MGKEEKAVYAPRSPVSDVALEYARKVNTDDDSKVLKSIEAALQQEIRSGQIGNDAFSEDDTEQIKAQPSTTESVNSNGSDQQANARLPSLLAIKHHLMTKPNRGRPTSSSDIVIRRTIGKSLAVRGTIYDQNVSMIEDTAAMITLVNEKFIPADNEDSETVTLRCLDEQLVTGKIIKNTSLDIHRINIQWNVCKAPLTDNVILGLDILDILFAVINLSTPTLTINNKVINAAFVNSGDENLNQQVCIKRTITVPSNSEMTVTIKTNKSADQEFILEPCPLTSCILVSHVVAKGNSCPSTILNDDNRHTRLKEGKPIGYIE
ncbi:unnamed protein product [Mytilus coruscus]|uniref:Uncharacterized protein n=1 Tax=Mytilus coruscus TaxID=42192 RepID=A0A6J8C1V9_MYTCO|nr:unnamed protein product [Mytilus coruscus]